MLSVAALVAAFGAGLIATAHCVTMCGPLIVSKSPRSRRIIPIISSNDRQGTSWYRQIGRVATYGCLGLTAGGVGAVLSVATAWIRFEAVLYLLFNVALVLVGLYLTGLRPLSRVEGWGLAAWQAIASRIKTKVIVAGTKRELALGVLWGLVPCAAIYSVLPLAILTGSAIHGAVLLLSFGLGTIPGHLALERSFSAATALSVGRSFAWAPRLLGVLVVCWGLAGVSFAVGLTERPSAILASLCGAR